MGRRRGRAAGWAWAALCLVGVAWVVGWGSHEVKRGDVDWLSAAIALPGLGIGAGAAYMSFVSFRLQMTDVTVMAGRLADKVLRAESPERARLLGNDHKPIDLRFALRPAPARNAEGADPDGRLGAVVDYYRRLRPRRLVITGAPGSGKTVLALELLLALLEGRDARDPVPVRMSLASWTTLPDDDVGRVGQAAEAGRAVETWVRDHLERVYQVAGDTAKALVEAGMILPVLDGLDEMDATDAGGAPGGPAGGVRGGPRARRALRALNAYTRGRELAGVVVTCRSGPYDALDVWARDAARVEVTPVTPAQARDFILARVDDRTRWRDVIHALDTDPFGTLARGLSTPWRLTTAVTVHEQREPGTGAYPHAPRHLLSPALAHAAAMRDHLNELYVRTAVAALTAPDGPCSRHTRERVHGWLAVLAGYLHTNTATGRTVARRTPSGSDLVLHDLWPLAGERRARGIHTVLIAVVVMLAAGIGTLDFESSTYGLLGADAAALILLPTLALDRWGAWTTPRHANPSRLRTRRGRSQATNSLGVASLVGVMPGLAFGSVLVAQGGKGDIGLAPLGRFAHENGLNVEKVGGLAGGIAGVILCVLLVLCGFTSDDHTLRRKGPRDPVRLDLVSGLVIGTMGGLIYGLAFGLVFGAGVGVALGTTLGAAIACVFGEAGHRYIAFLMCVRRGPHRLPWRLGRFLHHADEAGLLRTTGIAYQFRHRELQDWLAHHPTP
ncbi:NACHT domain-containing protein [Embleya sp. NPDC001921]